MKFFEEPKVDVVKFAAEDVITTSTEPNIPPLMNDCIPTTT